MSQNINTFQSNRFLASGAEAIAIGGNATDSIVIAGNNNLISITKDGLFAFQILTNDFLQKQMHMPGNAFYDGANPNWANIAHGDDSERTLYSTIQKFIHSENQTPYKLALILGLAGEGKTTLLRRIAWSLAEEGYPVLFKHHENLGTTVRIPLTSEKPLVIVFDEADQEDKIPQLASELSDNGVQFIILMAARIHEWRYSGLEGKLKRTGIFKSFLLDRLNKQEVELLINKLAKAQKLDALEKLPRQQQINHFLDRLKADGQLLPALLTARYGVDKFESILQDLLEKIRSQPDGNFLIRAYALIASLHSHSLWISRWLFAEILGISEEEVRTRVIGPLTGELLEVQENGKDRLATRHAVIAEHAINILIENNWSSEIIFLYQKIFTVLGENLRENPYDSQKKLLTILPLIFIRQGKIKEARQLFEQGTLADPTNAPVWQAWALMEQEIGNIERARQLFEKGTQADPKNGPSYQAWAILEHKKGNIKRARQLFEKGLQVDPKNAPTFQAWALMEQEIGNIERARQLFEQGSKANKNDALIYQSWALMEQKLGDTDLARELFQQGVNADPSHASTYQAWALMEQKLGKIESARKLYEKGIKVDPTSAHTYQAWALMEEKLRNTERAREIFEMGTKADPTNAPTYQAWALMEEKLGDIDRARSLFEQAINSDPMDAPAYQAWALMEQKLGNFDKARNLFERGIQADSKHAPSYRAWAQFEVKKSPNKALKIIDKALSKITNVNDLAWLYCQRGSILSKLRKYEEANLSFTKSLELEEDNPLTHYFFAYQALERQGKHIEAIQHYERALNLHPKNKDRKNIEYALNRLKTKNKS